MTNTPSDYGPKTKNEKRIALGLEPLPLGDTYVQDPVILDFFSYYHLKEGPLRDMSQKFSELARHVVDTAPDSAERSVALRKLLESKDAAVRSVLK